MSGSDLCENNYKGVNYSINELVMFDKLFSRIYDYFYIHESEGNIPDISSIHYPFKNRMLSNLKSAGIDLQSINEISNSKIKEILFDEPEIYIKDIYSLTKENKRMLSHAFKYLFSDLIIYVFILIFCIFLLAVNKNSFDIIYYGNIVVSVFICTTFDVLINTCISICKESKIKEFYE